MSSKKINLQDFPQISRSDWMSVAKKQLKGKNPNESLKWSIDDIELLPYYDPTDLSSLDYLTGFFQKVNHFEWKLYEEVAVNEGKEANLQALEALSGGCDGVIFNTRERVNLATLLKDITLDICHISFIDGSKDNALSEKTTGFLLAENGNTFLIPQVGKSFIQGLAACVEGMGSNAHILRHASPDFFLEIATLRALRFLLYDLNKLDPNKIGVHTVVPRHEDAEYQWFLNPVAGLASILGSSNSVTFTTAQGSARISRNVGNLIREESGINMYSGQCDGAYFIEALTHRIIESVKEVI